MGDTTEQELKAQRVSARGCLGKRRVEDREAECGRKGASFTLLELCHTNTYEMYRKCPLKAEGGGHVGGSVS